MQVASLRKVVDLIAALSVPTQAKVNFPARTKVVAFDGYASQCLTRAWCRSRNLDDAKIGRQ